MKSPADPILGPGDTVYKYTKDKHVIAEAILINLFHRFDYRFGCSPSHTPRASWSRVHRGLIFHEYITPNGRYLTSKGFDHVCKLGTEYTQNAPPD